MPSDPKKKPRARRIVLDTGPQSAQETRSMVLLGQRFIDYVQHERALSENTQAAYRRDLRTFGDWLAGRDATNLTHAAWPRAGKCGPTSSHDPDLLRFPTA